MKLINPSIFSDSENVLAIFTEANKTEDSVLGINFGLNTAAEKSEIENNYNQLLSQIGLSTDSLALADQVHGSNIEIVDRSGIYGKTDGLITKKTGLALGIQVADCAVVLIVDISSRIIGAFHAGWRGAVSKIIPKGIKKMEALGGNTKNFRIYISPCISKEMFEVGEEVAILFPDEFVNRTNYSKPHINLKGFLVNQMENNGINRTQIEISINCTMQNKRFFSYRRERDLAGRMLGLISLKSK